MNSSREIKVRFWYKGRPGMTSHVYTLGEILNGDPFEDYCNNKLADWRMMFERDEWTGLHDKNGRPIFEHDIVHWEWPDGEKGKPGLVTFDTIYEGDDKERTGWVCVDCFVDGEAEVIGNIHEHSHLLEGA